MEGVDALTMHIINSNGCDGDGGTIGLEMSDGFLVDAVATRHAIGVDGDCICTILKEFGTFRQLQNVKRDLRSHTHRHTIQIQQPLADTTHSCGSGVCLVGQNAGR